MFGINVGMSRVEIECHGSKGCGMHVEGEICNGSSVGDDAIFSFYCAVFPFCTSRVGVVPVHFHAQTILTHSERLGQLKGGRLERTTRTFCPFFYVFPQRVFALIVRITEEFGGVKLSIAVEIDINVRVHPRYSPTLIVQAEVHGIARESRECFCRQIVVNKARAHCLGLKPIGRLQTDAAK